MNLLLNPGFEDGVPDPWSLRLSGGCEGSLDVTTESIEGLYSGLVVCTTWLPAPAYMNVVQVVYGIIPDGPVYKVKVKYVSDVKITIRIRGTGELAKWEKAVRLDPSSYPVEATIDVGVIPSQANGVPLTKYSFIVNPRATGTVILDDLVLEAVEEPPPPPPEKAIVQYQSTPISVQATVNGTALNSGESVEVDKGATVRVTVPSEVEV